MKDTLQYLFDHKTLGKEDAKVILRNMAAGKYNEAEMAAFISVYLMRSITVEELAGFRDALLELCTPVDLSEFNTIDVCGTVPNDAGVERTVTIRQNVARQSKS